MLENLLEMARLSAGATRLSLRWNALEETVGTALASLQGALAAHTVETDLPADLPLVEYDALLMERVFGNLIENAAKYTPPGSRIRIQARAEPHQLTVQVCDNGPGLPPGREQAGFRGIRAGQPGRRASGRGSWAGAGAGHHAGPQGTLIAEPAPGGGACFRMALPRRDPPDGPDEAWVPDPAVVSGHEAGSA